MVNNIGINTGSIKIYPRRVIVEKWVLLQDDNFMDCVITGTKTGFGSAWRWRIASDNVLKDLKNNEIFIATQLDTDVEPPKIMKEFLCTILIKTHTDSTLPDYALFPMGDCSEFIEQESTIVEDMLKRVNEEDDCMFDTSACPLV